MSDDYFEYKEGYCFVNEHELRFTKSNNREDLRKKQHILWYYFEILTDFGPVLAFSALAISSLFDKNYINAILWFVASIAFLYRYLVTSTGTTPHLLGTDQITEVQYGVTGFGEKRGYFRIKYKDGKHKFHCDFVMPSFTKNGSAELEKARILLKQVLPEKSCLF